MGSSLSIAESWLQSEWSCWPGARPHRNQIRTNSITYLSAGRCMTLSRSVLETWNWKPSISPPSCVRSAGDGRCRDFRNGSTSKPHTQRSTWSWLMGRRHSRCRSRSQFGSLQRRQRKWWRLRWRDHLEKSKRYANTWTYRLRIYSSVVLYPTSHTGRAVTVFVHGGWTVLREYLWGEVTKVTQSKARLR